MSALVLFDFDGVLVNSLHTLFTLNADAARKMDQTLTSEEYLQLFRGNIHEQLKKRFSVSEEKYAAFVKYKYDHFSEYYNVGTVKMFPSMVSVISSLSESASLTIVSSAPEQCIRNVLIGNDCDKYFNGVIGINKEGKRATFIELLKSNPDCTYFITDTVGDIYEAKELPIKIIGVTWGFHSEKELREAGAEVIINTPEDLSAYLHNHIA